MTSLRGAGVTDADLAGLCEPRALELLALDRTRVSDDGLGAVAGLPRVRRLRLSGDHITAGGLRRLGAMPGLRRLDRDDCPNATDEGVERLRKALPGCAINR